jgi:hypothetical protein
VSFSWRELEACGLELGASILRLGASTGLPLIMIRGPNFSQALLMILSSAAMVWTCPAEAWLTSIVNFFMFILMIKYYVFGFFKADCLTLGAFSSFQHLFQDADLIVPAVVLV